MSFYESVELNQRERVSLQPGSYGTSSTPGLKILSYIDKASKLDKSGAMRHSFLVAASRPSREQLQAHTAGNGKAAAAGEQFFEPDYEGTAFLSVTVHDDWKHPAALALAFTEASRTKEGKLNADYVAAGIAAGEFTQQLADEGRAYYRQIATEKVVSANTPEDKQESAIEAQYRKELTQISIKMGQLFTLCDWKGVPRDPALDVTTLVGVEFSGKIEASNLAGKAGSEVAAVYSRSKKEQKAVA